MFRLIGLFALFPITMTLTISFFVLFAREKTTSKRLRSFAGVVAVLLWLCAALALIGGIVVLSTGRGPWMMRGNDCGMRQGYGHGMMTPCPGWGTPAPPAATPAK
jgi:cytochrome bd-type quinol oxidase subunit 1